MAASLPRTAVAAPSFPLFVAAYAGWATALSVWFTVSLYSTASDTRKPSFLWFLLTPVTLLVTARWVGKSPNPITLLRRSVAAHALSTIAPCVLLGIARSSDPGASGHGGIFLIFMYLIPFCMIVASAVGVVGAFAAFVIMQRVRAREARRGEPGAGSTRD